MLIQDFQKQLLTFILEASSGLRLLEHLENTNLTAFPVGNVNPSRGGNRDR